MHWLIWLCKYSLGLTAKEDIVQSTFYRLGIRARINYSIFIHDRSFVQKNRKFPTEKSGKRNIFLLFSFTKFFSIYIFVDQCTLAVCVEWTNVEIEDNNIILILYQGLQVVNLKFKVCCVDC